MALVEVNWRPDSKALRGFGLICLGFCVLIGLWIRFRHGFLFWDLPPDDSVRTARVLWVMGALCGLAALLVPTALGPLYVALTAISLPIGFVVSHVVVAIVFYGMFTPVALIFRLMRRDALDRHFDPGAGTYWVPRRPVKNAERYFRQY